MATAGDSIHAVDTTKVVNEMQTNCIVIPYSWAGFFGYTMLCFLPFSFLWLVGTYLHAAGKNDEEERLGLGLLICGWIISGSAWLLFVYKFIQRRKEGPPPKHISAEEIEMQEQA